MGHVGEKPSSSPFAPPGTFAVLPALSLRGADPGGQSRCELSREIFRMRFTLLFLGPDLRSCVVPEPGAFRGENIPKTVCASVRLLVTNEL